MRIHCRLSIVVLFIAIIHALVACDTGSNQKPQTPNQKGSVQLKIKWPNNDPSDSKFKISAVDCNATGIKTVQVSILTDAGKEIKRGGPYPCTTGKAKLDDIPAGQDRIVVVLAQDLSGNILYRGETPKVHVQASVDTSVVVAVHPFIPAPTFPTDGKPVSTGCSTLTFEWSSVTTANSYRFLFSETDNFRGNSVQSFDTKNTQISTNDIDLGLTDDVTYYWRVHALDSNGNIGAASDVATFMVKRVSQVTDFYSDSSSFPHQLHAYEDKLFFVARTPAPNFHHNFELFVTNGNASGTQLVKDIHPNKMPSNTTHIPAPSNIVQLGEKFYFLANDGTNGYRIWRTDGTDAGTDMMAFNQSISYSNPTHLTVVEDNIFFVAENHSYGRELWMTDGTAKGTRMVRDIRPGTDSSNPTDLTASGEWLYFVANDGKHGYEVWKTNGKATSMDFDLNTTVVTPGTTDGSYPRDLVAFYDGMLLFIATHGHRYDDREAWIIGGNLSAPKMVPEIHPGQMSYPTRATLLADDKYGLVVGDSESYTIYYVGSLFAFSIYHKDTGQKPYICTFGMDGTELLPSPITGKPDLLKSPGNFSVMGTKVFFTANDAKGIEQLWAYDLIREDTPPVALSEGKQIRSCRGFTAFGDKLYFSAFHPDYGDELWVTDGTVDGTRLVVDLHAAELGSAPSQLTVFNNSLYFTAFDQDSGVELFQFCP